MAGSLLVDALFVCQGHKITTSLKQTKPLVPLFKSLGAFGRQINKTVGQICAKGHKYFKKPNELAFAGEASQLGAAEELLETGTNLLRQDSQITAGVDAAKLAKLVEFENGVARMELKYGKKIVQDAKQGFKINDYKVLQNDLAKTLNELEIACLKIKKATEGKLHHESFIRDVGHGGNVTERSIEEALAARTAEDLGIFKKLTRAVEKEYDFVDEFGNKWDVKAFNSKFISNSNFKFNINTYIGKVKQNILKGEHILIDLAGAVEEDINMLNNALGATLSEIELSKIKFVDSNVFLNKIET